MISYHVTSLSCALSLSYCRLIIILLLYLNPNPKSLSTLLSYNTSPDKLSWRHLKHVLKDKLCLKSIIKIANACTNIGYWLTYFKTLTTIIILKPNKSSYDLPKSFRPIVLLNMLGKLIKKVISDRLQFIAISNNFIY